MTGRHCVLDIECKGCGTIVGWKYATAYEPDQKYKEGKYVIERTLLVVDNLQPESESSDEDVSPSSSEYSSNEISSEE